MDDHRSDIYVHLDRRWTTIDTTELKCEKSRLFLVPRIEVNWGSESLVLCELNLIRYSFRNGPYQYYHMLSGADLPIKSQDYINDFFDANQGLEFIDRWDDVYRRTKRNDYYYDKDDVVKNEYYKEYVDKCLFDQLSSEQRIIRNDSFGARHSGSNWFSLTEDAVSCLLQHEPEIVRNFCGGYCSDECFIMSTLVKYGFSNRIAGSVRHIEFNVLHPVVLTEKDIPRLYSSSCIFARKFDSDVDYRAIDHLVNLVKYGLTTEVHPLTIIDDPQAYFVDIKKYNGYKLIVSSLYPIYKTVLSKYKKLMPIDSPVRCFEIKDGKYTVSKMDNVNNLFTTKDVGVLYERYKLNEGRIALNTDGGWIYLDKPNSITMFVIGDRGVVDCCALTNDAKMEIHRPKAHRIDSMDEVRIVYNPDYRRLLEKAKESPLDHVRYASYLLTHKTDPKKARAVIESYVKRRVPGACHCLAELYKDGKCGYPQDTEKAKGLLEPFLDTYYPAAKTYSEIIRNSDEGIGKITGPLEYYAYEGNLDAAKQLFELYFEKENDMERSEQWARFLFDHSVEYASKNTDELFRLLFRIHTKESLLEIIQISRDLKEKGILSKSKSMTEKHVMTYLATECIETYKYYDGILGYVFKNKATEYLKKAIRLATDGFDIGDIHSAYHLGTLYLTGDNWDTAVDWFTKGIESNDESSLKKLFDIYRSKDLMKEQIGLVPYLERSTEPEMKYRLGLILFDMGQKESAIEKLTEVYGSGKMAPVEAIYMLLSKGTDDSIEQALKLCLGSIYKGLEIYTPSRTEVSLIGDPEAMAILGYMYHTGTGIDEDYERAKYWISEAKKRKPTMSLDGVRTKLEKYSESPNNT
ncbi:MAG: hypothetical protein MJZ68_01045 [archaeon]|nr:hypothetical protein [archaeon]